MMEPPLSIDSAPWSYHALPETIDWTKRPVIFVLVTERRMLLARAWSPEEYAQHDAHEPGTTATAPQICDPSAPEFGLFQGDENSSLSKTINFIRRRFLNDIVFTCQPITILS